MGQGGRKDSQCVHRQKRVWRKGSLRGDWGWLHHGRYHKNTHHQKCRLNWRRVFRRRVQLCWKVGIRRVKNGRIRVPYLTWKRRGSNIRLLRALGSQVAELSKHEGALADRGNKRIQYRQFSVPSEQQRGHYYIPTLKHRDEPVLARAQLEQSWKQVAREGIEGGWNGHQIPPLGVIPLKYIPIDIYPFI